MNKEIKEILDRLERIDHKEYSCDFEFADSATFDEMSRCFEERKKLANYITNLQQENERSHNIINELEKYLQRRNRKLDTMDDFDRFARLEVRDAIDKLLKLKSRGKNHE